MEHVPLLCCYAYICLFASSREPKALIESAAVHPHDLGVGKCDANRGLKCAFQWGLCAPATVRKRMCPNWPAVPGWGRDIWSGATPANPQTEWEMLIVLPHWDFEVACSTAVVDWYIRDVLLLLKLLHLKNRVITYQIGLLYESNGLHLHSWQWVFN